MNDMIKKIIDINEPDLMKRKKENPISELEEKIRKMPKALDFIGAFDIFGIIAEIKLASPSAGEIEKKENVLEIAKDYKNCQANAVSVITEKYFFKGGVNFIKQVKEITNLPILQKDFVVDPYQIYESRIAGADALLLIAKIISPDQLKKFVELCLEVGLEPVIEINDELDLGSALQTKTSIIAVNARDLDTFKVNIEKACELLRKIPENYLKLGFSGVNSREEVEKYKNAGARGILVGTNLIKSNERKKFLEDLR
ncbi:MAG TPA: indole-3-glycerol phosphate synthase TrpC [Patescibacteria group bacterium]|nr:indole-3-glycerol phosphate synthase TrpC [Patescibacteria group bacterium]